MSLPALSEVDHAHSLPRADMGVKLTVLLVAAIVPALDQALLSCPG